MIREPWSAANLSAVKSKIATYETLAMKHLADNMLEQLAADEVLNQKDRKIGGPDIESMPLPSYVWSNHAQTGRLDQNTWYRALRKNLSQFTPQN